MSLSTFNYLQSNLDIFMQLVAAFTPSTLIIRNDSHLHAHHAPMRDSTSKETHFQYATTPPLRSNVEKEKNTILK